MQEADPWKNRVGLLFPSPPCSREAPDGGFYAAVEPMARRSALSCVELPSAMRITSGDTTSLMGRWAVRLGLGTQPLREEAQRPMAVLHQGSPTIGLADALLYLGDRVGCGIAPFPRLAGRVQLELLDERQR